jgi:FkbM family methyltransferase
MPSLKRLLNPVKTDFVRICKANELILDYSLNRKETAILRDIFEARAYSGYFPFYQKNTIFDIGAHYGYFSLFAWKNSGPGSVIFAFEPDADNFKALSHNLEKNKAGNIHPFNMAVGAANEISKLYKGESPNNSLLPDYSLTKGSRFTEIETRTLARIIGENNIERIDFLKMDCEGSEYMILETLPDEVYNIVTTISMEFHDLKSHKYNGNFMVSLLRKHRFEIVYYTYDHTSMGLNYGRIIATKALY